jgi:uncharacterized protein (DUF2141 family)
MKFLRPRTPLATVLAVSLVIAACGGSSTGPSEVRTTPVTLGREVEIAAAAPFRANFLLGFALAVPNTMTLTHFGIIVKSAGSRVKMALYRDEGGVPKQLVIQTPATLLPLGRTEIPVTNTELAAGTYWIMAIYDQDTEGGRDSNGGQVDFVELPFNDPLPTVFPSPSTFAGGVFNYYIKGVR